jgi:hypothetical protein
MPFMVSNFNHGVIEEHEEENNRISVISVAISFVLNFGKWNFRLVWDLDIRI